MAPYRVLQYLERARYYVHAHHQGSAQHLKVHKTPIVVFV